MSFLINSFIFGVAAVADWYATFTDGNADVADELAIHSSGTVTIPSAWNGRKVRASVGAIVAGGADIDISMSKNGSAFNGRGVASFPNVPGTNEGGSAHSAPVVVSTGDTFTFSGGGGINGNWRGVELLPNGVKGALVNRITSGFAVTTTGTIVDWNNEVYDTDSFHDNSTNPSRLTVQSGTSGLVRIQANVEISTTQSQIYLEILKNGSQVYSHESTNETLNIMTPPISVVAGDYFQLQVTVSVNGNVNVSAASWMAIEELPSTLKYAIATGGNSSTLPTGGVWTTYSAATETADTGAFFTAGANKFVVPSGVTRVRCGFFGGSNTGLANAVEQAIFKNGSDFDLSPHNNENSTGNEFRHACSTVIEVAAGDTLDFYVRTSAGSQTAYGTFWVEEVPDVT